MFTITEKALAKFIESQAQLGEEGLMLRLSARRHPDHGIVYNMGFDRPNHGEEPVTVTGMQVLCDAETQENTQEMVIDYGEHDGIEQFLFLNPNDAAKGDPESCGTSPNSAGCGSGCSCG